MEALVWVRPRRNSSNARIQPGDVVAVRPDGWAWGKREGPPDFAVVQIPDLTDGEIHALTAPEMIVEPVDPLELLNVDPRTRAKLKRTEVVRARAVKLDLERMTAPERADVARGRAGRRLARGRLAQLIVRKAGGGRVL